MPVLLDGSMGAALQKLGAPSGPYPELVNLTMPELVTGLHKRYVDAGSEIIYANTFSVSRRRGEKCGYDYAENIRAALLCARNAGGADTRVALDIAPTGEFLEPYGDLSPDDAYTHFSELVKAGASADLISIETMSDLEEAGIALRAAKDTAPGLPVFVTMTFALSGRTINGYTPQDMVSGLEALGANAIGLNCSLGPAEALPVLQILSELSSTPLIVKPNAGMPDRNGNYAISPKAFADAMKPYISMGVAYIGGCCGTSPEYISELGKYTWIR